MRIHFLQHVSFEDIASIQTWADQKGYAVTSTSLFEKASLPSLSSFDWLIIMGGPMNVYEDEKYSWLQAEKTFIRKAIDQKKKVLGVCLGGQLIADVLGARIAQGAEKEIGWFPVKLTEAAKESFLCDLPQSFQAFHWHGDAFEIPQGAVHIASSEACPNQAFQYQGHVLGVQFHLESSQESIQKLVENCQDELTEGKFIQEKEIILNNADKLPQMYQQMVRMLEQMDAASLPFA